MWAFTVLSWYVNGSPTTSASWRFCFHFTAPSWIQCVVVEDVQPTALHQVIFIARNGTGLWNLIEACFGTPEVSLHCLAREKSCLWCGLSPLARFGTKTWCWKKVPRWLCCAVMCFSFCSFFYFSYDSAECRYHFDYDKSIYKMTTCPRCCVLNSFI